MESRLAAMEATLAARTKAEARAPDPTKAPEPAADLALGATPPGNGKVLRISLAKRGAKVDGLPVSAEQFDATLLERARASDIRSVMLQVDPDLPHSEVTAVLDRIKRSGVGGGNVALVRGEPPTFDALGPDDDDD